VGFALQVQLAREEKPHERALHFLTVLEQTQHVGAPAPVHFTAKGGVTLLNAQKSPSRRFTSFVSHFLRMVIAIGRVTVMGPETSL
jgi:hypothetical protein